MSKSHISRHMKENKPFITTPGINHLAPEGLMPILANFRIAGHGLPYKIFLFTFNNTSGSVFSYEKLINTIDKDLIIDRVLGGSWVIKTSTGKPIKDFNKHRMYFQGLDVAVTLSLGPQPYQILVPDNKSNWTELGVPFYSIDAFSTPVDGISDNLLGILCLFDLTDQEANVNVQTS